MLLQFPKFRQIEWSNHSWNCRFMKIPVWCWVGRANLGKALRVLVSRALISMLGGGAKRSSLNPDPAEDRKYFHLLAFLNLLELRKGMKASELLFLSKQPWAITNRRISILFMSRSTFYSKWIRPERSNTQFHCYLNYKWVFWNIDQLLEDIASKQLEPYLARGVQTVVAAYILQVARYYSNTQLEEYVLRVIFLMQSNWHPKTMQNQWDECLLFKDNELTVKKEKYKSVTSRFCWSLRKRHKKLERVNVSLDRETVVTDLCKIQLLVQVQLLWSILMLKDYKNKDLKQLLMTDVVIDTKKPVQADQPKISVAITTSESSPEQKSRSWEEFKAVFGSCKLSFSHSLDDKDGKIESKKKEEEKKSKLEELRHYNSFEQLVKFAAVQVICCWVRLI